MMTCEEVQKALKGSPERCTAAERQYIPKHIRQCAACEEYYQINVVSRSKALLKAAGPVAGALLFMLAGLKAMALEQKDSLDPEINPVDDFKGASRL